MELSLFQQALGMEYEEERVIEEGGQVVRTIRTRKWIPPCTTAQIFGFKNRQAPRWRDRPEPEGEEIHAIFTLKGPDDSSSKLPSGNG